MKYFILTLFIFSFGACQNQTKNESNQEKKKIVSSVNRKIKDTAQIFQEKEEIIQSANWQTVDTNQTYQNGIYTFQIAFAEWGGKSLGATCIVKIKGDSIQIVNNGSLSGKKGEIIAQGKIMRHLKTRRWIVAQTQNDIYAPEIGGCSDAPTVIDFKNKVYWLC
jgi:hypothetical protein